MKKQKTFEESIERLEEIASELESGKIKLDDMMKIYEEGSQLIKFCLKKLDTAEKKIKELTGKDESTFNLNSFEE